MKLPRNYKGGGSGGFTLIELLVVIGVLTTLLAIVLVAINPSRQFSQANNTQRRSDVSAILNAVHQYAADNAGDTSLLSLPSTALNISSTDIDICTFLVDTYIAEMPVDPTTGSYTDCTDYDTGYSIAESGSSGRITVSAPNAELSETISVTR
jgi:type IV pilus assembly protein PilA